MCKEDICISEFPISGYEPLVDFESWRVAGLTACQELQLEQLETMQKHEATDEVFVLLAGSCVLFTAGKESSPKEILAIPMEPQKLYNVKRGVWHTHWLDQKAVVLIVENRDTNDGNSPLFALSQEQKTCLRNEGKKAYDRSQISFSAE